MKKTLARAPKRRPGFKSFSLRARLGGAAALLALTAALGLAAERPAHTAGGPIAVNVANSPLYAVTQDSDNPARQPVSVTVELSSSTASISTFDNLYTVPAGKRLVIDYVTSTAESDNDPNSYNFFVTAQQNGQSQHINFNELPDTSPFSAASEKVALCADPGTSVSVVAYNNQKANPDVLFTMSGHLVNLP